MARQTKKAKLPPNPQPKAWGYARVSTSEQDMRMQRDALIAAGVHPDDIFEEKASGASTERRREFQALMKELEPGDVVYVWKLDRLGRNTLDLIQTAKTIEERGAQLVVLTMLGAEQDTPHGKLLFAIFAAFAEFERSLGVERTKAGLAAARARGRSGGRKPEFTLEQLEAALAEHGSYRAAAASLRTSRKKPMTLSGFTKALERERARKALEDESDEPL